MKLEWTEVVFLSCRCGSFGRMLSVTEVFSEAWNSSIPYGTLYQSESLCTSFCHLLRKNPPQVSPMFLFYTSAKQPYTYRTILWHTAMTRRGTTQPILIANVDEEPTRINKRFSDKYVCEYARLHCCGWQGEYTILAYWQNIWYYVRGTMRGQPGSRRVWE